ncbi:MAG: right-handed parallel beta-helix repeat-containing protein [Sedimentisphaerales bacterium]|nr:right-handed parallel beta-helix repeat-containing protein [Sedimentisphaerales bacterium]HNY76794.1 right-handed parallel beta-helix repeat-containing protein [Sedimentisphaerales bacterium]HOC61599.1 right-handed parallel beta-helix repeat-containing protein [Sedimentisphaerales bacterium]HOH62431.1 right-handed parallel beta-helix repeat-containing protein [Sedimentisphaerales bacterium]HQN31870.1 right-handed parallel beta-helix repeat-containing protein [Sedimentisphaerales bacterium]
MRRTYGRPVVYAVASILVALSARAAGATYFVDASTGADGNSGLSPTKAWQTIGRVNRHSCGPGDEILFRRGQMWRETLEVRQSGREGSPITYGAYGTGDRPIINGADVFGGNVWSREGETVWSKRNHIVFPSDFLTSPAAINKFVVSVDGTRFLPVRWPEELASNTYTFDPAAGKIYLYLEDDPDSRIVESAARDAVVIRARHHVILQGLEIVNSPENNILIADGSHHVVLRDIVSHHAGTRGVLIAGPSDGGWTEFITIEESLFYNHGIIGDTAANDIGCGGRVRCVTVRNCVMHGDGKNWGVDGFLTAAVYGAGNVIEGNLIFNHSENEIDLKEHRESGDGEGRTVIRDNVLYGSGGAVIGLHMGTRDVDVVYNHIHSSSSHGISIYNHDGLSDHDGEEGDILVAYNIIRNNTHAGLCDRGRRSVCRTAGGNRVYNNVIAFNGDPGITFTSPDWDIRNNILYRNDLRGTEQDCCPVQVYIGWQEALSGLVLDGNILTGPDGQTDRELYYYAGAYCTLAWLRENTMYAKHSLAADPGFVDAAGADFHLRTSSVAVDAGLDVGMTEDFDHNPVPAGRAVDIGAYEFISVEQESASEAGEEL